MRTAGEKPSRQPRRAHTVGAQGETLTKREGSGTCLIVALGKVDLTNRPTCSPCKTLFGLLGEPVISACLNIPLKIRVAWGEGRHRGRRPAVLTLGSSFPFLEREFSRGAPRRSGEGFLVRSGHSRCLCGHET